MANKRKAADEEKDSENNNEVAPSKSKKGKWTNKERVLVFCARGITHRARHLMNDLKSLMPHCKSDTKLDRRDKLFVINEVCELKNCNKCIFFEMRKKKDLFMWISCAPHGPSAKFLVENVHTMDELKLTGNCLKGSRPILSFDKQFDESPHMSVLKEMFAQTLSTPNHHPKTKPFVDHVLSLSITDGRIWFRNYQIVEEDGSLLEIGPRFVLNLIRIFEGSFGGPTLFENPVYISPNEHRRNIRKEASQRYINRKDTGVLRDLRRESQKDAKPAEDYDDVFKTVTQADIVAATKL